MASPKVTLKQCCALGRCIATTELKACAACSETLYCSREHQVEHFKEGGHKMICPGRTKGPPLTFQQCAERANHYHTEKMWVAALPYYGAMLELTERVLGLFHFQAGNVLEVMATCYRMTGRIEHAIQCLQRVCIVKDLHNDGSVAKNKEAFSVMGLLSELYVQTENLTLAKELLTKTEELAKDTFGEQSFERGRAVCALAGCLEQMNEHEAAIDTFKLALSIEGYARPTEPIEIRAASTGPLNLAILLSKSGQWQEAVTMFQQALNMRTAEGVPVVEAEVEEIRKLLEDATQAAGQVHS